MKIYRQKLLFVPALLSSAFLLLLFTACGGGNSSPSSGSTKTELKPANGGEVYYGGVLKFNELEYFRSIYPLNTGEVVGHRIGNQIYEGLLRLNQTDLSVVPCLAEKMPDISADGKTYTFTLRKGVKFHDDPCFADGKGRELKAADVVNWAKILHTPAPDNKGYDYFKGRIVGGDEFYKSGGKLPQGVSGVTAVDEYTVKIELTEPLGFFNVLLTMPYAYIFPEEARQKYGENMRIQAVGTGAFTLKTVKENDAVLLLKNPNYWDKDANGNQLPYLDGIRVSFVKEHMAEFREFTQGKFDFMYRIPLEIADEVTDRKGSLLSEYKKYQLQEAPSMQINYYGFLTSGKIFNNKKIRLAFNYAVDRQSLADNTMKGAAMPASYGFVPPVFAGDNHKTIKGYTFDAALARKLLSEAGYPEGKGFPEITLQINSGGKRNEQLAEAVVKMLEENLGVKTKITQLPFAQHLETHEAGKVDFWRAGWVADYPDPENFLTFLWGAHLPADPSKPTYLNTFRWKNAEFDRIFEQAIHTTDNAQRNALYEQADQIIVNDAPCLLLTYSKDQRLLQPNLRNYPQNAMEYRLFRDVYFVPQ